MGKERKKKSVIYFPIWKQIFLGLFVLLSVLLFSIFFVFELALQPTIQSSQHAERVAKEVVGLTSVEQIQTYRGKDVFYTVIGVKENQTKLVVIVPSQSDEVVVFPLNDGISEEEAIGIAQYHGAGEISRTVIGYREKQPIWEVKSGTAYYLIEFESGNFIKKEGL